MGFSFCSDARTTVTKSLWEQLLCTDRVDENVVQLCNGPLVLDGKLPNLELFVCAAEVYMYGITVTVLKNMTLKQQVEAMLKTIQYHNKERNSYTTTGIVFSPMRYAANRVMMALAIMLRYIEGSAARGHAVIKFEGAFVDIDALLRGLLELYGDLREKYSYFNQKSNAMLTAINLNIVKMNPHRNDPSTILPNPFNAVPSKILTYRPPRNMANGWFEAANKLIKQGNLETESIRAILSYYVRAETLNNLAVSKSTQNGEAPTLKQEISQNLSNLCKPK